MNVAHNQKEKAESDLVWFSAEKGEGDSASWVGVIATPPGSGAVKRTVTASLPWHGKGELYIINGVLSKTHSGFGDTFEHHSVNVEKSGTRGNFQTALEIQGITIIVCRKKPVSDVRGFLLKRFSGKTPRFQGLSVNLSKERLKEGQLVHTSGHWGAVFTPLPGVKSSKEAATRQTIGKTHHVAPVYEESYHISTQSSSLRELGFISHRARRKREHMVSCVLFGHGLLLFFRGRLAVPLLEQSSRALLVF